MNALSLYGITAELSAILSQLDENGGELTPELEQALAINEEQFATKAVDYGHAILNLKAMATAAKAEKDRLARLQKFYENATKRLTDAITAAMQAFERQKVESGTLRLSLRHTQAVGDDYDLSLIPKDYKVVKVEEKPDKEAIKAAILAGHDVPGARLVENVSLLIK